MKLSFALLALIAAAAASPAQARTVQCQLGLKDRLFRKDTPKTVKLEVSERNLTITQGEESIPAKRNFSFRPNVMDHLIAYHAPDDETGLERSIFLGFGDVRTADAVLTIQDVHLERGPADRMVEDTVYHCGRGLLKLIPMTFPMTGAASDYSADVIAEEPVKARRGAAATGHEETHGEVAPAN